MKATLTVLCLIGVSVGLVACSQDAMDAMAPVAESSMTQAATIPADGSTSLSAIASRPERFLEQRVLVRGRISGWRGGNPALTQDGTSQVLPLLGDARHLVSLFPQVDGTGMVEITGIIATNNTGLTAAVGIVPKQIANV